MVKQSGIASSDGSSMGTASSAGSVTRKLIVRNVGKNVTSDDMVSFFNLDRDDYTRMNSAVEISRSDNEIVALVHVLPEIYTEALAKHGTEL